MIDETLSTQELIKLGDDFFYGKDGQNRDYTKAAEYFLCAAEKGDSLAQRKLALMHKFGYGVEKKTEKYVYYLEQANLNGDSVAPCLLGKCYKTGLGVEPDIKKAIALFEKSASQGYDEAQYQLALAYIYGDGVEKNMKMAYEWLVKAAEQGHDDAQVDLALMILREENDGTEYDEKKAFDLIVKAAEHDNDRGQRYLGLCYLEGEIVEKNLEEAEKYLLLAANQGDPESQYNLAELYRNKEFFRHDDQKAFEWYQKAAAGNYDLARLSVAECHLYGIGVKSDVLRAMGELLLISTECKGDVARVAKEKYQEIDMALRNPQPKENANNSSKDNEKKKGCTYIGIVIAIIILFSIIAC